MEQPIWPVCRPAKSLREVITVDPAAVSTMGSTPLGLVYTTVTRYVSLNPPHRPYLGAHWWGLFLSGGCVADDRVVLFIDYQNAYREARRTYHLESDPFWCGQFDPGRLGELLVERSPYPRSLGEVRVYRGMPANEQDPKSYAAARRQIDRWTQHPKVTVITRTLTYRTGERPREKGIDVALAVDFVTLAQRKLFDVGLLFSRDTDLKPALEYVCEQQRAWGKPRAEVVAWRRDDQRSGRLSAVGHKVFCHWISEPEYTSVADSDDYT